MAQEQVEIEFAQEMPMIQQLQQQSMQNPQAHQQLQQITQSKEGACPIIPINLLSDITVSFSN